MKGLISWVRTRERILLKWANRRASQRGMRAWLGGWFSIITHMGGATFTLGTALLVALLGDGAWRTAALQSAAAVIVSHLPVALVKHKFRRLRPHQALPGVLTGRKPLIDSSFPSGHTTAIFAWMLPWLQADASLLPWLLPLVFIIGISVAWSRMYLGLHYPSDVVAGAVLGSLAAIAVSFSWRFFFSASLSAL